MPRKSQPPPKDTDVFPPIEVDPDPPPPLPKPPVKGHATPPPSSLRVAGCELLTAPDHVLLVKMTGDESELIQLKQAIGRALVPEATDPGAVPEVLHGALPHG